MFLQVFLLHVLGAIAILRYPLTSNQRLVVAALSAVAITIGVSFIPDVSVNGMKPLAKGLTLLIAGVCFLFAAPAVIVDWNSPQ